MNNSTYISFYLRVNRIHIFCDAVRTIGQPHFVRFLINEDATAMIMEPYDKMEFQSMRVPKEVYNMAGKMEFCSTPLCQLLSHRLGWDTKRSYRVHGKILTKQGRILYDLTSALPINDNGDDTVEMPVV